MSFIKRVPGVIRRRMVMLMSLSFVACQLLSAQTKDDRFKAFENQTGATVSYHRATKVPGFIKFPIDRPLVFQTGTAISATQAFVATYGLQLGISSFTENFRLQKSEIDQLGFQHLTYQQSKDGIPVFDGQLKFHFDQQNRLRSINGVYLPELKVSTIPAIREKDAADLAISHINEQMSQESKTLLVRNNELNIFRKGLVQGFEGQNYLTYKVEVVSAAGVREFVFVDAHTGQIIEQFTGTHSVIDRKVFQENLGNLIWDEGDPLTGLNIWQKNEVEAAGHVYNLFKNAFGFTSFDNQDGAMLTIHENPTIICPNANWNGTTANYCDATASDDVVAHEWGHAYTDYTSNLIYAWQSGALNESYSDIWGETIDLINGYEDAGENLSLRTGCSSSHRWLIGEDASGLGGAIRDMWNPTCKSDPGKVSDASYSCSSEDQGGVHSNSGVNNHAYALLVDGGSYNGFNIDSLGFIKSAHIFWRAMSYYLTQTSDFSVQADALEASCSDLIGINLEGLSTTSTPAGPSGKIINTNDLLQVQKVISAVEMRLPPDCAFQPLLSAAPALCVQAVKDSAIWYEDFETGLTNWTITQIPGNPGSWEAREWQLTNVLPDGRAGTGIFAPDPINGDCETDLQNGIIRLESPVVIIPAMIDGPIEMAFAHYLSTERLWDGGNIKYSINSGAWTLLPSTAFSTNAYNASLNSGNNDNPLAGQMSFTGSDDGSVAGSWSSSIIDLSTLGLIPGSSIQFRWELGTDGCNGRIGWYLDDISIYSCKPCTENLNLHSVWNTGEILFDAANSITSVDVIGAAAKIIYSAGQEIDLNGGFEVNLGSELNALIDGCDLPAIINQQKTPRPPEVIQTGDGIQLTLSTSKFSETQVTIFDQINHQKLVDARIRVRPGTNKVDLDAKPLDPGFYFCKVAIDGEMHEIFLKID